MLKSKIFQFLLLSRPFGWLKNFFIFAPLFFSKNFFNGEKFFSVCLAFIAFCISASAVYVLNDVFDKTQDSKNHTKKHRPVASGKISIKQALLFSFCLVLIDIIFIFLFIPQIFWAIFIYFFLNIIYSSYLKRVAVIDILFVVVFYFIRIMVGAIAANVPLSHWLLLCIISLSLFLIVGKRFSEFYYEDRRAVLEKYSSEFLSALLIISATLAIVFYSTYSVFILDSDLAILSIFLVLLGIIRYIFIVFTTHQAEYPEKVLMADKVIFFSSFAWGLIMCLIFYLNFKI
jgi:4-hydroxybenzoate polyprenyltransferase